MKKLRVGIISANWGVFAHLPAWRSVEGVEVVAICTSRRETARQAADAHGFAKAYDDFRAMAVDSEIDLIDVGTRPPLRHPMVSAAFENGKHVYCGMPFASTLAAARDMASRQAQAGTVGVVDAFIQAVPALARMKEMIDEGFQPGIVHCCSWID